MYFEDLLPQKISRPPILSGTTAIPTLKVFMATMLVLVMAGN